MGGDLRLPERRLILEELQKPSLFLATVVTFIAVATYRIVAWYREYCVRIVGNVELALACTNSDAGGC